MAQRSGLFDSTEIVSTEQGYPKGNRAETADFFARYFSNFIGNGIFAKPANCFAVEPAGGLDIKVRAGACFINGYAAFDDADETMTLTAGNTYYIVQRAHIIAGGDIQKVAVMNSSLDETPRRDGTYYDLLLAVVTVPSGASEISYSMITDYRYDSDYCGLVHATVDQLDTSEVARQLRTATDEFIAAAETQLETQDGEFDAWFVSIRNKLGTDPAGELEQNKSDRIYLECDGGSTAMTAAFADYYLAVGQTIHVKFAVGVPAGATLNVNSTGNVPIYKDGAAVTGGDIPAGHTAAMVYNGTQYALLNPFVIGATPTGYQFYTANDTFVVPNGVTAIKINACAAGVGRYAGEYLIDRIFNVTPGQSIDLTIGSGNTVIGDLVTLVAGSVAVAFATTKLGYASGYNGGGATTTQSDAANTRSGSGGFGGAFGFGGGGGGGQSSGTGASFVSSGAGGAGIGGAGSAGKTPTSSGGSVNGGTGGGTTGGAGGRCVASGSYSPTDGENAKNGALIYTGATGTATKGGDGSIYGAGGGGGATGYNLAEKTGGGGAAGGYGAGAGQNGATNGVASDVYGQPSSGMVMIEWGGAVA